MILAGWASNNKYSFIGGLRSSAQLISYEIPLGLSILGMVLVAGSLDLNAIINWQDRHVWGIFVSPLGFLIFLVSAFAETNRLPFDLPESEQELVGGFHTEYSAMKFGMFFLGEYLHVITVSFLTVILFFGGWDFPFVLDQDQTGLSRRARQDAGAAGQGGPDDPLHDVGPLDAAAVPLRPAHGPGLEVADPAGARQPGGHGGDRADDRDPEPNSIDSRCDDSSHGSRGRASRRPETEATGAAAARTVGEVLPAADRRGAGGDGRHIAGVMFGNKAITMQYPEEQHVPSPNYRGVHRLNKDEQGRVKCVACMLCATACPAHCIDIVGATAPPTWPDREKYPESFVIDELRCIYCGMCEEACPVEAIELTGLYDLTGLSREQMIFDKTKLLSVFDATKDHRADALRQAAGRAARRRPRSCRRWSPDRADSAE